MATGLPAAPLDTAAGRGSVRLRPHRRPPSSGTHPTSRPRRPERTRGAVLDLLVLADVVVMAVTDEAYADHLVAICSWRYGGRVGRGDPRRRQQVDREPDAARRRVANARRSRPVPAADAPPAPGRGLVADRSTARGYWPPREAAAFRESIACESARGERLKRRNLEGAAAFLDRRFDEVLQRSTHEAGRVVVGGRRSAQVTRGAGRSRPIAGIISTE